MSELYFYSRGSAAAPACWQDHIRTTELEPGAEEGGIPSSGDFTQFQQISAPEFIMDGGLFDYQEIAITATDAVASIYDYDTMAETGVPWVEFLALDEGVWVPTQQIDITTYGPPYTLFEGGIGNVDIAGEWAVVGATQLPASDYYADIIIYQKVDGTWEEAYVFSSQTQSATSYLGRALAISPDAEYIMYGLYAASGGPAYVYVYHRTGDTWAYHQSLSDPDAGGSFPDFGASIALSNDTAVIGYPGNDVGGSNRGRAYIFTRSGTTWSYAQTLDRPTLTNSAYFGNSVAISETNKIVVADRRSRGYVFDYVEGTWTNVASLTATSTAGTVAAISPDGLTAVLASTPYGVGQTPMYVNEYDGESWEETQAITPVPTYEGLSQVPGHISYRAGVIAIPWYADDIS